MTDYTHKYLMGHCHGLAFVLANLTQKPVGVLYANKEDGQRINDPMHVFVDLGNGQVLDVKGERSAAAMTKDFEGLAACLQSFGGYTTELLDEPDDLYGLLGMDYSSADQAAQDILDGHLDFLFSNTPSLSLEMRSNAEGANGRFPDADYEGWFF